MHVAGKPILAHILDDLRAVGVDELVLVVGRFAEQIEQFVADRYPIPAHFVHQDEPLGNGHAVYVAREHLTGEPVVIVMGDTVIKADLGPVLREGRTAIGVHAVDDPSRFGVVLLDGDGLVRRVVEKPTEPLSHLAIVGVYVIQHSLALRRAVERLIEEGRRMKGEYWLADALQLLIDDGEPMTTFEIARWYDCGTAEALLEANRALLDADPPPLPPSDGSVFVPPVSVAPGAVIEGSVIGPHVSVAEGAVISHAVVRDAIVNAGARVEMAVLDHSIIGEQAEVSGRALRINVGESSIVEMG